MSLNNWWTVLKRHCFLQANAYRRGGKPRSTFIPQLMRLEERCCPYTPTLVNGPVGHPDTSLSQVLFAPANMPVKLITIMNNSPNVVYPILLDANSTIDNTAGQVVRITLTNAGSGYSASHPPTVVFTPAGASATVQVDGNGHLYGLILNTLGGGSGYTKAPTISFDDSANGNKGSGASATATISVLPIGSSKQVALYDSEDAYNQGYRGYIGEYNATLKQVVAGLQPYTQVTVQVPLVFWDGGRIFFASNGTQPLSGLNDPANPVGTSSIWSFNTSANAYLPAAGMPYSATFADPASGIANPNGRVLWYHDLNGNFGGPHGFAEDAPGQLTEFTIRDPMQVTWAPDMPQSELANPILNYDVSYVDELGLPAIMETTNGYPATNPEIGTSAYAGIGADLSVPQMQQLIADFTQTAPGTANTLLGDYFGGKGYDQYVFPSSITGFELLPGGYNLFLDSALANTGSAYNTTNFKLASGGAIDRVSTNAEAGNGVVTVGSSVISGLAPSVVAQLVPGMIILNSGTGPGNAGNYFSSGTTITSVDVANHSVTLSTPAYFGNAGQALTFVGSQWTSALGSTDGSTDQITGIDPTAGQYLSTGMLVTGPGINGYDTISQLITTAGQVTGVMLSGPVPASGTASSAMPYVFSSGPSSYVASALIKDWYAWADYYVQNVNASTQSMMGSTKGTNNLADPDALVLSGLSSTSNLVVGDVVSGPNINTNAVTAALIANGGTGYKVNDILTVSGGTVTTTAATLTVTSVNAAGAITGVMVSTSGSYSTPPTSPVSVTGGKGKGATFNLTTANTTIAKILSGTSVQLSNAVLTSATGTYTFTPPVPIPRSSDAPAFGTNTLSFSSNFTAPYGETPLAFAQTVYDVMSGFSRLPPSGSLLSQSAQLLSYCIGANIGAFGGSSTIPTIRDNELRDELKAIMRGVSDFTEYPEFGNAQSGPSTTSLWYPNPANAVSGSLIDGTQSTFNVFNLSPYVWFVHDVLGMNGYGFSVDDDTADVGSLGSDLEIAYGGTMATAPETAQGIKNLNYYTGGTPYGPLVGQGYVDNTSGFAQPYIQKGFVVIALPTTLVAKLVAADSTTVGALVTAGDGSLPQGSRVANVAPTVGDPTYPKDYGAVIVQLPSSQSGSTSMQNGPTLTYTFTGFNTLLPVVTSFSPSSGAPGSKVTIAGSNFAFLSNSKFVPAVLSVTFNGIPVSPSNFTVNSASSLTVTVPGGATSGLIAVRSSGGTGYSTSSFTVTVTVGGGAAPLLNSFTPTSGSLGTIVQLSGAGFTGATQVTFDGLPATSFLVTGDSTITATVPGGAATGPIVITTPNGTVTSTTNFTVNAPSITSFTPSTGVVGTVVTITGSGFTDASAVNFNSIAVPPADFEVVSDTTITVPVPMGATIDAISVTTSAGTGTSATDITVNRATTPIINFFAPSSGVPGTVVTIAGSGFTAATAVTFNGVAVPVGDFAVLSDSTMTALVPALATTGTIAVTTSAGTGTSATTFTVTSATIPTITSFTPTLGPEGTSVTLTGTGFTAASDVSFNGTSAPYTVLSDTTITTAVPFGATSGTISVTNSAGTGTSLTNFVVAPPGPPVFTTASSATFPVYALTGTYGALPVTLKVPSTSQLSNGMLVTGPGIAANTTITVASPTSVTLSQTATPTTRSGIFVFGGSSFQVAATGATSYTLTGTLPTGVSFTDNGNGTATIAGEPLLHPGNYLLKIKATDASTGLFSTQTFTLTVSAPPGLSVTINKTPASSATYTVGATTNPVIQLTTAAPAGTTLPTTLTVTGLPAGVKFTPEGTGGRISGTPTAATGGVYLLTITARNAVGSTVLDFTLTVNQPKPAFSTPASATFTPGQQGTFVVKATGYPTLPTLTTATPAPSWLTFTPGTGTFTITGTPPAGSAKVYTIPIVATIGTVSITQKLVLTVKQPVLASTSPQVPEETFGGRGRGDS